MSWLISQALMNLLCSQEQVEESLVDISLDGEQSVQLNGNPTQQAYCVPDKMTEFSRLSRFGMTFKPLTESRGEELLTLYLEGFPAKTYPQQEVEMDLKENEVECGEKWRGSFTKYDPTTFLWKTHQCSLLGDLEPFLETWPQWGLMQDGECWELTLQDLTIGETESGLLPTILATDWKGGTTASRPDNGKLRFDQWRDYVKLKHGLTYPHPTHSELRMAWPQGWTDLKPLEMDKFLAWQHLHGESSVRDNPNDK